MEIVAFLVYGLSILSGVASFGVFTTIYFSRREPLVARYLPFHVIYSSLLVFAVLGQFGFSQNPNPLPPSQWPIGLPPPYILWHAVSNILVMAGLSWAGPRFLLTLADKPWTGRPRWIFSVAPWVIVASLPFLLSPYHLGLTLIPVYLGIGVMAASMLYANIVLIYSYGKVQDKMARVGIGPILAYNVLCIGGGVVDGVIQETQTAAGTYPYGAFLIPSVYLLWNMITLRWAAINYGTQSQAHGAVTPLAPVASLGLTDREMEIAQLVCRGLANKEIAGELQLSQNTVRNHLYNIYGKTNAKSRVDLYRLMSR